MPRYLATDYLAAYLREKQNNQEHMLKLQLPIPHHLEVGEVYLHHGVLPDEAYRRPWLRVNYGKHQIPVETGEEACKELIGHLSSVGALEALSSDFRKLPTDLCDFVPSSNPESPISSELGDNQYRSEDITSELFLPCCLNESRNTEGISDLMEEVEGAHDLWHFLRLLPSVKVMVRRIPSLITESPPQADEHQLLRSDRILNGNEKTQSSPTPSEVFSKEELLTTDFELMECDLVPDDVDPHDVRAPSWKSHLDEALSRLPPESMDSEQGIQADALLDNIGDDVSLESFPEQLNKNQQWQSPKLTEIFGQGIQDTTTPEASYLESPTLLHTPLSPPERSPWAALKQLPLDTDSGCSLLSPEAKEALELSLWLNQKFPDDVLNHRLPEPAVLTEPRGGLTYTEVLELLTPAPEVCDELHMSWVPVDQQDLGPTTHTGLEPFTDRAHIKVNDGEDWLTEDAGKYQIDGIRSDQDCDDEILPQIPKRVTEIDFTQRKTKLGSSADIGQAPYDVQITQVTPIGEVLSPDGGSATLEAATTKQGLSFPASADPLEQFMWMKQHRLRNYEAAGAQDGQRPGKADPCVAGPSSENQIRHDVLAQEARKSLPEDKPDVTVTSKSAGPTGPNTTPPSADCSIQIVQVPLTGDYLVAAVKLSDAARPLLQRLRAHHLLSASQSLGTLTPAATHFILKQYRKTSEMAVGRVLLEDADISTMDIYGEVYPDVVGLHGLVDTLHCLLHGSLTMAAARLAEMAAAHPALPPAVGALRQMLFETHMTLEQHHVRHPKVLVMCDSLTRWTTARRAQGAAFKILVVISHGSSCLANSVREGLMMVEGLQPEIFPPQVDCTVASLTNISEETNCVIACRPRLLPHLPLAHFSYVVEYEHNTRSGVHERCTQLGISYLGLGIDSQAVFIKEEPQVCSGECLVSEVAGQECPELILIGSQDVTADSELIHTLEASYNMLVVERDYCPLVAGGGQVAFCELIIDQSACVVLQDLGTLSDVQAASPLILRLAHLSSKFSTCWLILHAPPGGHTAQPRYQYAGMVPSSLARLHAGISHLLAVVPDYRVQVLHSKNAAQTAKLTRQIAEKTRATSKVWTSEEWLARAWLSPTLSKSEEFLLRIPFLNSFSAQLLLRELPLDNILRAGVKELSDRCPQIPQATLQGLWQYLHMETPVGHQKAGPQHPPTTVTEDQRSLPSARWDDQHNTLKEARHADNHCEEATLKEARCTDKHCKVQVVTSTGDVDHHTDTYGSQRIPELGLHEREGGFDSVIDATWNEHQEVTEESVGVMRCQGDTTLHSPQFELLTEQVGHFPASLHTFPSHERLGEVGRSVPNEFERVLMEQKVFISDQNNLDFVFNPMVKKEREEEEFLNVSVDTESLGVAEEQLEAFTRPKRTGELITRRHHEGIPSKVVKMDPTEPQCTTPVGRHLEEYVSPDLHRVRSVKQHYPTRPDLHLWTAHSKDQQKPPAFQQGTSKKQTMSTQCHDAQMPSSYNKTPRKGHPGTKNTFVHRFSGSKISGSVSRYDDSTVGRASRDTLGRGHSPQGNAHRWPTTWCSDGDRVVVPVIPKVRHPQCALQLDQRHSAGQVNLKHHLSDRWQAPACGAGRPSPPMDLSPGAQVLDFYGFDTSKGLDDQEVPKSTDRFQHVLPQAFGRQVYSHMDHQRKLTFKKVPGAPNGQTRLTFG